MLDKSFDNLLCNFLKNHSLDSNLCPSKITLSPLKNGKSHATLYQFKVNRSFFILRIPPTHASFLTKAHQSFLAQQAGELGIGPKVHYIDPQFDGIILSYIPGNEAKPKDFQNEFLIDKMANVLRKLHQDNSMFPIAISPFKRFNDFLQKVTHQNDQITKMKLCMDEIEQTLRFFPVPPTPTHLDLHLSNIILKNTDEIFLIDWVNGGMSDPFFDLATFSYFSELNKIRTKRFLRSYFQRDPTEIETARFNVILPVRIMVIAASLISSSKTQINNSDCISKKVWS